MTECPCGTERSYAECCQPYHKGESLPKDALALMRSRYCAYALSEVQYLIDTTDKRNPQYNPNKSQWKQDLSTFIKETEFFRLVILEDIPGDKESFVTFHAQLFHKDRNASFTERSRFEYIHDRWYYVDGIFPED